MYCFFRSRLAHGRHALLLLWHCKWTNERIIFFSLHKIFKFDEHTSRKVKAKQTKTKQCFKSGNCGQTVMTNRFDVDHSESVCLNQMKMFNGEITTTTMTKSPNNFTATVASARAASIHFFIHAVAAIDGCLFLFVIALDKMLFLSHLHTRKVSLNNRILILQMLFALTHDTIIPTKQKQNIISKSFFSLSLSLRAVLCFFLFSANNFHCPVFTYKMYIPCAHNFSCLWYLERFRRRDRQVQ